MNQPTTTKSTPALRAFFLAAICAFNAAPLARAEATPSVEITTAMKDQALVQPNSEAYEKEVARLRTDTTKLYDFDRAILSDVLRALASDANLNYLAMPENQQAESTLVTIHLNQAPFVALETVANAFGVALIYEGGVWHMRPFDDKQVIARNYRLKYNLTEEVSFGGMGGGGMGGGGAGAGGGGGFGGGGGGGFGGGGGGGFGGGGGGGFGGGGGGGGGGGMGGIGIGSSGMNVSKKADGLLENIKAILGIPTHGFNAPVAGEVSVGEFGRNPLMVPMRGGIESDTAIERKSDTKSGEAAVAWNSDNNSFFIVATRQQHQFVEAYLNSFDKKQYLIGVEIKFYETSRDPRSQFGMDWSGWANNGLDFAAKGSRSLGAADVLNPTAFLGATVPASMILNAANASAKLQFLSRDSAGKFTSYPRVVTLNNRPVQIQSVVNQPILSSSSSVTPGVGGTSTQNVQYLPIGTSISVVPKRIDGNVIALNLQVTVSTISGTEIVGGNKYPIPSTRAFQNTLQVDNGYTVAIAGLDEALDTREGTGIPILSKIPFAGWAFKNKVHDTTKKNLMIFITPTLMDTNGNGVSERPISELPRYKGDLPRNAPQIYSNGELIGGPTKMAEAVLWTDQSVRRISGIINEGRAETSHREELSRLADVVEALTNYLPACHQALSPDRVTLMHGQLNALDTRISNLKSCYRKNHVEGLGYGEKCDR